MNTAQVVSTLMQRQHAMNIHPVLCSHGLAAHALVRLHLSLTIDGRIVEAFVAFVIVLLVI